MKNLFSAIVILIVVVGVGYLVFRGEPQNRPGPIIGQEEEEEEEENNNELDKPAENLVEVKVGKTFVVKLESNPTTGYSWQADFSASALELVRQDYIPKQGEAGEEPIVGAGGEENFEFKALKQGKSEIVFSYLRPWESVQPLKKEVYLIEAIQAEEFCGWSTLGTCQNDNECKKGGCSGQVCQSIFQDSAVTTCEYRDCYNALNYNLTCKCVESICQWHE